MHILFLGDIIGKPGRDVVAAELPGLRNRLKLDLVIANGENSAGGFGLTRAIAEEFYGYGVDVITTGSVDVVFTVTFPKAKLGVVMANPGTFAPVAFS